MSELIDDIMPSAAPTDDEIRRWEALPRDEQLKRLRQALVEGEQSGLSDRSITDIKSAALKRLDQARNG